MTDKTRDRSRRYEESDHALALPGFGMPRIFEDFMQPLLPRSFGSLWGEFGREPSIDIQDRGDHYVLTAELPGFDKEDVEVKISGNVLELKGERKTQKETRSREGTQMQSSSSYIQRYQTLPEEVASEKVSGTMKNGVLELKLPKEPKAMDRSKKVDLR